MQVWTIFGVVETVEDRAYASSWSQWKKEGNTRTQVNPLVKSDFEVARPGCIPPKPEVRV